MTASGDVSSMENLVRIKAREPFGLTDVIVGKAVYKGKLYVREACRLLQEEVQDTTCRRCEGSV